MIAYVVPKRANLRAHPPSRAGKVGKVNLNQVAGSSPAAVDTEVLGISRRQFAIHQSAKRIKIALDERNALFDRVVFRERRLDRIGMDNNEDVTVPGVAGHHHALADFVETVGAQVAERRIAVSGAVVHHARPPAAARSPAGPEPTSAAI